MEDEHEPRPRPALKDKINQAFDTLHPADRGPYSNREVVAWLAHNAPEGESSLSLNYLLMLRSGERDNPTLRHIEALARFFRISPAYFMQDAPEAQAVYSDLQLLAAMQDKEVRGIAARALDLDPKMRTWLHNMVSDMPTDVEDRGRKRPSESARFVAPPDGDS